VRRQRLCLTLGVRTTQQRLALAADRAREILQLESVRVGLLDLEALRNGLLAALELDTAPPGVPGIEQAQNNLATDRLQLPTKRRLESRVEELSHFAAEAHQARETNIGVVAAEHLLAVAEAGLGRDSARAEPRMTEREGDYPLFD